MRSGGSGALQAGTVLFATSCTTSADRQRDAMIKDQQAQIEAMRTEMVRKHVIDSMNNVALAAVAEKEAEKPIVVQTVAPRKSSARKTYTRNYVAGNASSYSQPAVYNEPVQQPIAVQQQKKGWSAKAKGAVIGTAVGAGAGAIINKRNRAAGAVIGAVLGAGAGTGIGAIIDKKNNR